jgi:hypothetical protein
MNNTVKGAGAPAEPAPRPLTLFNTLITVPRKTTGERDFKRGTLTAKMPRQIKYCPPDF